MRTRDGQVAALRADQQFWRDLAATVGPERYAEPGPMGRWSFGDLAGHLLGWRDRTIERLEALGAGLPDPPAPWPADLDEGDDDDVDRINDWIQARFAGQAPAQLVAAYDASYDRLIAALDGIDDDLLADPNRIPWLEGSALVDIAFTGHLHDEHVPGVRAWLRASR